MTTNAADGACLPDGLPAAAYAAALASLAGMGPARLHRLLSHFGPQEAWSRVRCGLEVRTPPGRRARGPQRSWLSLSGGVDVAGILQRCRSGGIEVSWPGDSRWPAAFGADPEPPGIVFWRGDLAAVRPLAVAIVGTRQATPEGRSVAFEMARDLARAGVSVVSGLALGIDGAAHAGALEAVDQVVAERRAAERRGRDGAGSGPAPAATVGVAASGVDVVYPHRHADLWRRVVASGVVLSETPPGEPPTAWRFPARNRIIVALVRTVIVVESHAAGGSMVTVDAALARGIDVAAVPGPVRSPSSAGTNQLLRDGATPVRHAGDVLDGLGMVKGWPPTPVSPATQACLFPPVLDAPRQAVLDAVGWHPTASGPIMERTGLDLGPVGRILDELETRGLVVCRGGQWSRIGGSGLPWR